MIDDLSKQVYRAGDTVHVDLWYPRAPGEAKAIQVGLCCVRAADDLRITYDFERDGWVIEQAQVFEWPADDFEQDPRWIEVAFVQAWAASGAFAQR